MEQLFKHYMGGLSEDIQQKLDLVIKGNQLLHKEIREVHDVLRQEIRSVGDRSDQRHDHATFLLNTLNGKVETIAADLATHRKDTEAHGVKWSVREKDE